MEPLSERIRKEAISYDKWEQGGGDWLHDFANEVEQLEEPKTIHLSRGLSIFVNDRRFGEAFRKVKLLCLQPGHKDCSRTAWAMWTTHTEERLEDGFVEKLVTKGD